MIFTVVTLTKKLLENFNNLKSQAMKKITISFFLLLLLTSCGTSVKLIGDVNIVSTRNVDENAKFSLVKSYAGGSDREIKKARNKTIDDAINQMVKATPGGELLKNAKIYLVSGSYYAVTGDVWGYNDNAAIKGFKVGDKVTWKNRRTYLNGVITALKNDKICLVKVDNSETIKELSYDEISKL